MVVPSSRVPRAWCSRQYGVLHGLAWPLVYSPAAQRRLQETLSPKPDPALAMQDIFLQEQVASRDGDPGL